MVLAVILQKDVLIKRNKKNITFTKVSFKNITGFSGRAHVGIGAWGGANPTSVNVKEVSGCPADGSGIHALWGGTQPLPVIERRCTP